MARPTPEDALRLARRRFVAPDRIDLSALADALGVNRVTLYRWFGSRDGLLVETLWSLADRALQAARAQEPEGSSGAERTVAILCRFLATVIEHPGMRRWLAEEGEHAMRLLTRHDAGFQPRLIAAVEGLLAGETVELPVDRRELAFVVVRLIESYTYLDLLTGERPDAERARPVLRMLFRLDSGPQPPSPYATGLHTGA